MAAAEEIVFPQSTIADRPGSLLLVMSTASSPSRLNKIRARGRSAGPVAWEGELQDRCHADSVIAGKRFLRTKWFRM